MATDITKIKPQILIQDEGVDLTRRDIINFVGAGVTATDDALNNKTIVTIPGGGGGGATGIWGIADATGVYTYYSTIALANAAASAGDTIVLFTNVTETGAVTWTLVDGVNINLNGHTYTLDTATGITGVTDGGVAVECKISNGRIIRLSAISPSFSVSNASSNIILDNVFIESVGGISGNISGTITGGVFDSLSIIPGFISNSTAKLNNVIIYGGLISISGTARNCNMYSRQYYVSLNANSVLDNCSILCDLSWGILTSGAGNSKVNNCVIKSGTFPALQNGSLNFFTNCYFESNSENAVSTNFGYFSGCTMYSLSKNAVVADRSQFFNCNMYGLANGGFNTYAPGDNKLVNCNITSLFATKPAAFISQTGTSGQDQFISCNFKVQDSADYCIRSTSSSSVYLVNNTYNTSAVATNNIVNSQVNTADNFGNILVG